MSICVRSFVVLSLVCDDAEMEGSKELKGVPRAYLVGKPNQKSAKQMLHSIINIPNQNSLAIEAFFSVMSPLVEGSRVRGRIIITVLCAAPRGGGGGGRVQGGWAAAAR